MGFPYSAWRDLGPLGIDVLSDAARVLQQQQCTDSIEDSFPLNDEGSPFNAAILICMPKKVVHHWTSRHITSRSHCGFRRSLTPITTLWRVRPRLEIPISQAGFLKGRSMMLNVLLVDTRLRTACAESDRAGAVFFEFEAAFP